MPKQHNIEFEKAPKVFISYSWSSKEHVQWVLELATNLVENGIDIIIDKWDLPEGEDKYKFMERIVNDKSVDKVLIVSDKLYADKSNNREGGVGTETQIISTELYEQFSEGDQKSRFVALVCEKDEKSKPYLPTYYKNRIYIDCSDDELKSTNFEQLVRWIFDKPLHKKPEIGKPPHYILEEDSVSLGTQGKLKILFDSFKNNPSSSKGALINYLDTFCENLDRFKLVVENDEDFYEVVVNSIKQLIPFRDEFVEVVINSIKYLQDEELSVIFHSFFEELLKYKLRPKFSQNFSTMEKDNYRYIIFELFIYYNAVLLKYNKFALFNETLSNYFYLSNTDDAETGLYPYTVFNSSIESFYLASEKFSRISYTADQIVTNAKNRKISLTQLMQTDFIFFLRSEILLTPKYLRWNPLTGVFIASRQPKFELFLRSESKSFFEKFKVCLGVKSLEELKSLASEYHNSKRDYPSYFADTLFPPTFMNLDNLCTRE